MKIINLLLLLSIFPLSANACVFDIDDWKKAKPYISGSFKTDNVSNSKTNKFKVGGSYTWASDCHIAEGIPIEIGTKLYYSQEEVKIGKNIEKEDEIGLDAFKFSFGKKGKPRPYLSLGYENTKEEDITTNADGSRNYSSNRSDKSTGVVGFEFPINLYPKCKNNQDECPAKDKTHLVSFAFNLYYKTSRKDFFGSEKDNEKGISIEVNPVVLFKGILARTKK